MPLVFIPAPAGETWRNQLKILSAWKIARRLGWAVLLKAVYHQTRGRFYQALRKKTIRRRVLGSTLMLSLEDQGISKDLLLYGTREKEHVEVLREVTRPGMKIFDVGANIGFYAVLELGLIGPTGRLLAIEPSPINAELLRVNLDLNGGSQIPILQAAVSDKDSTGMLQMDVRSNLNRLTSGTSTKQALSVPLLRLETIAKTTFSPDLIRMDIEGHEVQVLTDLARNVGDSTLTPSVLFEAHPSYYSIENDIARPLEMLALLGYRAAVVGSADDSSAVVIEDRGYRGYKTIRTDGTLRTLFRDVDMDDLIHLIAGPSAIRTILISPPSNPQ